VIKNIPCNTLTRQLLPLYKCTHNFQNIIEKNYCHIITQQISVRISNYDEKTPRPLKPNMLHYDTVCSRGSIRCFAASYGWKALLAMYSPPTRAAQQLAFEPTNKRRSLASEKWNSVASHNLRYSKSLSTALLNQLRT